MSRLTKRNFNGMIYVPGYAPRCDDPKTCELIVVLVNRLAALEDLFEKYGQAVYNIANPEECRQMMKEGIIE